MVFSFESLAALVLFASGAFAWALSSRTKARVRLTLRFAAVLFAALGVAGFAAAQSQDWIAAALAVATLVASLGAAALGLSVFGHLSRPPPPLLASVILSAGLMLGLAAALSGVTLFALAGLLVSAAVMMALGLGVLSAAPLQGVETILGATALAAGGLALMENALAAAMLFFAAGVSGLACASQPRVDQQGAASIVQSIGRTRL